MTRKFRKILQSIFSLIVLVILFFSSTLRLNAAVHRNQELKLKLAYARVLLIEFREVIHPNIFISKPDLVETFIISKPGNYSDKSILAIFAKATGEELEILVNTENNSYILKLSLTKTEQSEDLSFVEISSLKCLGVKFFKANSIISVKTSSYFWDYILNSNPDLIDLERIYDLDHEKFYQSIILKISEQKQSPAGELIIGTENFIYKIPFELVKDIHKKGAEPYAITENIYLD